jgi:hypothetical protein
MCTTNTSYQVTAQEKKRGYALNHDTDAIWKVYGMSELTRLICAESIQILQGFNKLEPHIDAHKCKDV